MATHSLDPSETSQARVLAEHAASIRQLSKRVIGDVIEIGRAKKPRARQVASLARVRI